MILCVIPARGGSKGLPKKNILPLLGKPVIGYTIEAALKETILNRVVVSTEDHEIATCASEFGVEIIHRPPEMSTDDSNIDDSLRHAVETIEREGKKVEIVVWLKANVPIRKEGEIQIVVRKLIDSDADSVITVRKTDLPIEVAFRLDGDYLVPCFGVASRYPSRQHYPDSYYHSGAVYAIRRSALMRDKIENDPGYFFGQKKFGYIVNEYQYGIEIDDGKDFLICELFLQRELGRST